MLVIGFDGPMTTASLGLDRPVTSSVLSGGTFEQRTTSSILYLAFGADPVFLVMDETEFRFYPGS